MSGTSLDGVDAVLLEFSDAKCLVRQTSFSPFSSDLRRTLLELHHPSDNELERSSTVANSLSAIYASTIEALLAKAGIKNNDVLAVGCHGQTIRHRPDLGFTLQIANPALLAELVGITVVADFRSRDIAAGGQGAPLVPAFHKATFHHPSLNRVLVNIGGIANLTYLPANGEVVGFDTGPGNMLMDAWIQRNKSHDYDKNGDWAATGNVIQPLLKQLLSESYFSQLPPKSTGRDLFNLSRLLPKLRTEYDAADVQCTLLELTAQSIALAINMHCHATDEIYLCGGGANNQSLTTRLRDLLQPVRIEASDVLGIAANSVEGAAFAWLAKQALENKPGNLPAVTGARGPRILGAIYAC
jgi:anhydro-N-acetylmuramic acid kinase